MDIGAVEGQAPFLPVGGRDRRPGPPRAAPTYTFTVTYSDPTGTDNGVMASTLINNNNPVRVTGPDGFDVPATYVSIDNPTNGSPRTVTYSITPPGGNWDWPDNGDLCGPAGRREVQDLDNNSSGRRADRQVQGDRPVRGDHGGRQRGRVAPRHLNRAVADPANDTIEFDPAVFASPQTIGLLSALPLFGAGGPDPDRAGGRTC